MTDISAVKEDFLPGAMEPENGVPSAMKHKSLLLLILILVVGICSIVSHAAVGWLGIKATFGGYKHYGSKDAKAVAVLYSSSPGYDGIDWDRISELIGGPVESWATPGSSPSEWEMMQTRSTHVSRTFVAFSSYDLNEYFLCDFRANIVPLSHTIEDLRKAKADWSFSKRMLSQYPVMYSRQLFPTIGRSDGVLVGIRANLEKLAGRNLDAGEAPKFASVGKSDIGEKITDWDEARLQRRLLLMRAAMQGKVSFNGPKHLALIRLLRKAERQGPVVLLVLPNSPIFRQEFMSPSAMRDFEAEIVSLQQTFPQISTARLDQTADLGRNDYYFDPVHLNMYGQQVATEAFLERLRKLLT